MPEPHTTVVSPQKQQPAASPARFETAWDDFLGPPVLKGSIPPNPVWTLHTGTIGAGLNNAREPVSPAHYAVTHKLLH